MQKKNSLIKNYLYNSVYQIFAVIIPLITTPYISRVLMPVNNGINSYINSVVTIFTSIGLMGLSNYSLREIAYVKNDQEKLNKTFMELFLLRIIYFVFTVIIYLIYAYYSEYSTYYYIYLFTVIGSFIDIAWLFQGIEELKVTVIRSFIIKTISTLSIFLFVNDVSDLNILMLIYSLTSLVSAMVLFLPIKSVITRFVVKDLDIKRHIIPNLKLFLPQVATLIYCQFDKVMINSLWKDVREVGFYNQAEKIVKIPLTLITSLSMVMLPRISNEFINSNYDNVKRYVTNAFRFSLLLSIPLTCGLAIISRGFIPWFLGTGYEKVIMILVYLSITVIFISLSSVSGSQYLTATNQTRILTISYVSGAIVNFILNYFLIGSFGAIGASIATIVAEMLVFLIQGHFMRDIISILDILKLSIKYIIASLAMLICCASLYYFVPSSILLTSLQILTGLIVYFGMLILLKDEMFINYLTFFLKKIKKKDK